MNSIQSKIERMQQKSIQEKQQKKQERQEKWHNIKTEFPDIAELMISVNKVFGKPQAVGIRKENEVVFLTGKFDQPKNFRVIIDRRRK